MLESESDYSVKTRLNASKTKTDRPGADEWGSEISISNERGYINQIIGW